MKDETNPFYMTCERNVNYLNEAQTYGDALGNTVNSIIGNTASLSSVFLLIPISSTLSAVVTVVGGISAMYSIQTALFDAQVKYKHQEFVDAMYNGKFNFYIYYLCNKTSFGTLNYSEFKSFHPWDTDHYVRRINMGTIYDVKPLSIITLKEIEEGTWRVAT